MRVDLRERARPYRGILILIVLLLLAAAVGEALILRGEITAINERNRERMARCDPLSGLCLPDEIDLNTPNPIESFKEPSVKSEP